MENLFKDTGSNSFRNGPDDKGRFGDYGGRFVSETLMPLIIKLEKSYQSNNSKLLNDKFLILMYENKFLIRKRMVRIKKV